MDTEHRVNGESPGVLVERDGTYDLETRGRNTGSHCRQHNYVKRDLL